ncbi:transcription/translation regulatory transformer protein RfaH [Gammaproteobacteria bacterium]|nr:transcription/translation regulatory transformer protein RfaH [Gammaproteobacteria bacterium]
METEDSKWFLIYTKAREEERAKKNLESQGVETFLPMVAYEKKNQPNSFLLQPMFPRYLFITINIEGYNWAHIKSTRGVSHAVIFNSKLAEVPSSVVTFIKTRVDDNNIVKQKVSRQKFQKGDKLVIKKGALKGMEAIFFSTAGKERVKILLNLMNEVICAEISGKHVGDKAIIEKFKL